MDELIAEMKAGSEYRQVRDHIAAGNILSEGNTGPFEDLAFKRFCNVMISAHWDSVIRRGDGITVSGDGVEVRTQKVEAGKMAYTAAPAPAITS